MNLRTKSAALLGLALATAFPLSVSHAQTGSAGAVAEQRVSLDVKNIPIQKAIGQLFRQAKSDFSAGSWLEGNITVKIVDQPLDSALRMLSRLSRVPFVVVKQAGVYVLKPRDSDGAKIDDSGLQRPVPPQSDATTKPSEPVPAAKVEATAPAEPKFSLDLRDAPIREALEKLFRQAKVDFSLDNSVQGYVTLRVTDQPFETVLRLLISRSAVPLTWVKEGSGYFVKPRQTNQSAAGAAMGQGIPGEISAQSGGVASGERTLVADQDGNRLIALTGDAFAGVRQMDVIYLTYLDPADIAQLFKIVQIPSFSRQGGAGGTGGTSGTGGTRNGPGTGPGLGPGPGNNGGGNGNPGLKQ